MKRKQRYVIVVCAVIFVIGMLMFFLFHETDNFFPVEYNENAEENYIVYGDKKYKYNEHLSNYLFMGIDTRDPVETYEGQSDAGQSDTIFLLSYNRVEKTVTTIAIPRDTLTNVHIISAKGTEVGTSKAHITTQYAYGDGKHKSCELMKQTVSETLYGIPIQGYCSMNMDGIPIAVEQIGKVDVVVPNKSLEAADPIFKEGAKVSITKDNAETFVRHRDTNITFSAMDRLERQKVFLKAFAETLQKKSEKDVGIVKKLYNNLDPYMVTNMGTDVFAQLAEAKVDFSKGIQNIPGEKVDGIDFDEYHINDAELYEMILELFYEEVQGE